MDLQNNLSIAILGYLIVFSALVLLYIVFTLFPKLISWRPGRNKKMTEVAAISGEVNAAISMAIFLYFNEQHDEESHVMTIRKIARVYSPWNSKIYAVRNIFNRDR